MEAVKTIRSSRLFEGKWVEDGYDFIGAGQSNGWHLLAGWGADGWDLGSWPLVVYLFRDSDGYERASYCEGDITIETFASREDRERSTDEAAFWYWRHEDEEWIRGIPEGEEPDRLRGQFSRGRSEREAKT